VASVTLEPTDAVWPSSAAAIAAAANGSDVVASVDAMAFASVAVAGAESNVNATAASAGSSAGTAVSIAARPAVCCQESSERTAKRLSFDRPPLPSIVSPFRLFLSLSINHNNQVQQKPARTPCLRCLVQASQRENGPQLALCFACRCLAACELAWEV
jgi:hypothetical protein